MDVVVKHELVIARPADTRTGLMASFTAKTAEKLDSAGFLVYQLTYDQVKQVRDHWQRKLLSSKSQPGLAVGSTTCLNSLFWVSKPSSWRELTGPMLGAWCKFSTAYATCVPWGLASAPTFSNSGRNRLQQSGNHGQQEKKTCCALCKPKLW